MATLYTWKCLAHGEFDAFVGKCPHGCGSGMVQKVFQAGQAFRTSGKTALIDRKTADLARQFGDKAFNDRHDKSRIDMSSSEDIQQKRMTGQTYSVPISEFGAMSALATPDISGMMKQDASMNLGKTTIVADDHGTTKLA